jgi:hypothetical protein
VNSTIVRASAREVYEAYYECLERRDFAGALFWRQVLLERLGLLNGAKGHSGEPSGPRRDGAEG